MIGTCIWLALMSLSSIFAYDLYNYARLSSVYLLQMYALKESDPATWGFLEQGSFSVK